MMHVALAGSRAHRRATRTGLTEAVVSCTPAGPVPSPVLELQPGDLANETGLVLAPAPATDVYILRVRSRRLMGGSGRNWRFCPQ